MSVREKKVLSLTGISTQKTNKELNDLFKKTLNQGMHGLCISPYEEGQKPGDLLTEKQIRRRLEIIKPYTKWIRSFSCTEGNELIPRIAKELGMKTLVGAWLGNNNKVNQKEIAGLIELAKYGFVDIAAVGNEVMYRKDLTEEELLAFMHQVKQEVPNTIPIGYVDAYYEFTDRPKITEACDVILANCYPYWEGCPLEYSLLYMKDMYNQAIKAANGKKVIISETGWPSFGENFKGAYPSKENFIKYFINTQQWAEQENMAVFYFSSFDEPWKVGTEGNVGAFWGLWDKNEDLKF